MKLPLIAIALATAAAVAPAAAQTPPPAAPRPANIVQLEHISIETRGTRGSPVILLPGLASPRASWEQTAQRLERDHRVYLVQVNGFAGDDPRGNLNGAVLDGIVADLVRYISAAKLRDAAVVGHSMGGLVGLMLAARHPDTIGRLMTVDALPFFAVTMAPAGVDLTPAMVEPQAARMRDALTASYGKPADPAAAAANVAGMTLNADHRPQLQRWAMAADPRVVAQVLYEDLTTDMRAELPRIKVPVTVVYAWNATYPRQDRADAFFRSNFTGLVKADFAGIGPAAHFVMFDQPAAFAQALDQFLQR